MDRIIYLRAWIGWGRKDRDRVVAVMLGPMSQEAAVRWCNKNHFTSVSGENQNVWQRKYRHPRPAKYLEVYTDKNEAPILAIEAEARIITLRDKDLVRVINEK